jgi:aldehyde dehydrogenase (NAD+)
MVKCGAKKGMSGSCYGDQCARRDEVEAEIKGNYIAGQWREGEEVNEDVNPSDLDEIVGRYARASQADVDDALAAADAAFPSWSRSPLEERRGVLQRIGDELLARREELGRLLAREEGKPLAEGIGEITRAAQFFHYYAAEVLRQTGENADSVRPGVEIEVRREPLGTIAIITPWNFPAGIPAWKVAPALAYGNCVVLKPADLVPASAWALADIVSRSGLPEGVFNLVMGRGRSVGEALLGDRRVSAITFTGSVETGARIAEAAARRLAKVQLEMGGKNPLVVLDDADLETAVSCAAAGAFGGTGQKCTASSRLIVTEGIHDRFVDALGQRMRAPTASSMRWGSACAHSRSTMHSPRAPRSARWSTKVSSSATRTTSRWASAKAPRCSAAGSCCGATRRATIWPPRCSSIAATTCASIGRRSSGPSPP